LGVRAAPGSERPGQALLVKAGDTVVPVPVGPLQERHRRPGVAGPVGREGGGVKHFGLGGHAAVAEEGAGPVPQAARADVDEPPGDGGHRRRRRLRATVQAPAPVGAPAQAPAALHRLPEVLLVAEPLQARPQVDVPVELQLADQHPAPVELHSVTPIRRASADPGSYATPLTAHPRLPAGRPPARYTRDPPTIAGLPPAMSPDGGANGKRAATNTGPGQGAGPRQPLDGQPPWNPGRAAEADRGRLREHRL